MGVRRLCLAPSTERLSGAIRCYIVLSTWGLVNTSHACKTKCKHSHMQQPLLTPPLFHLCTICTVILSFSCSYENDPTSGGHPTPLAVADWVAELRAADMIGLKPEGLYKIFKLVMVHREHIYSNSLTSLLTGIK